MRRFNLLLVYVILCRFRSGIFLFTSYRLGDWLTFRYLLTEVFPLLFCYSYWLIYDSFKIDSEGRRGKKGGRILPRHVWSLQPGVRFVVPVNSLDQPVRKGGHVLVRFLGDVAKNGELCPVGEINWHKVDKSCKANIINLIRVGFSYCTTLFFTCCA